MWWRRFVHVCYKAHVRAGRAPSSVSSSLLTEGEVAAQDGTGTTKKNKPKRVILIYVKVVRARRMPGESGNRSSQSERYGGRHVQRGQAACSQRLWLTRGLCGRKEGGPHPGPRRSTPRCPLPASPEKLPSSPLNLTWSQFNFPILSCARGLQNAWSPPAPSVGCPVVWLRFSSRRRILSE